jgi:predicted enzyme related to lactoylglutathione lyase/ketosteroid isomerase-like protein
VLFSFTEKFALFAYISLMPQPLFYDFVTAINEHDTDRLSTLMTVDHILLDAQGKEISGQDTLQKAWISYFKWFPDYIIELSEVWEMGPVIMATGFASASFKGMAGENGAFRWKIPAAWKAIIREDKISHWQVFADTKIPYDSMQPRAEASPGKTSDAPARRVAAIGGVFFKSQDPEKLKAWYARHLGFHTDAYGTSFVWKQASGMGGRNGFTVWSPFPDDTAYFGPSVKPFMLNYRVENIHELVLLLKEEGVTVLDEVQTYPYGKFVHIMDPENNKIELWEADDEEYGRLAEGVTGY